MRDLRAELEAYEGNPPAWKPEERPILVGTIQSFDGPIEGNYGNSYVMNLVPEGETAPVAVWMNEGGVLFNECTRLNPQIGEKIGVKYLGEQTSRAGMTYKGYKVLLDRPEGIAALTSPRPQGALTASASLPAPQPQGTRPPAGTVIDNRGNVVRPGNGNGNGARTLGEAAREKAGVGAAAASRPAPAADDPFAEE